MSVKSDHAWPHNAVSFSAETKVSTGSIRLSAHCLQEAPESKLICCRNALDFDVGADVGEE
jgi:hypothetical protein